MLVIEEVKISDVAFGLITIEDELSRIKTKLTRKNKEVSSGIKELQRLKQVENEVASGIRELQSLNKRVGELELVMSSLRKLLST